MDPKDIYTFAYQFASGVRDALNNNPPTHSELKPDPPLAVAKPEELKPDPPLAVAKPEKPIPAPPKKKVARAKAKKDDPIEALKMLARGLLTHKKCGDMKEILREYGVEKVSYVPEDKYDEIKAKFEALLDDE